MALATHDPAAAGYGMTDSVATDPHADYADHVETYRRFVQYVAVFAAHVLVILALLAYFLT
jgi:hypothetical protein